MNTYANKIQEKKSSIPASSLAQKKHNVMQALNFVDNRPESVSQRQLQETTKGNSGEVQQTVQPQKKSNKHIINRELTLQRKIKTKTGTDYTNVSKLPSFAKSSKELRERTESGDTWLVKSPDDLDKKAKGNQIPMLSPHRHLIGEQHSSSKFSEAVSNWGWGADKMEEGLNSSSDVMDTKSNEWMNTAPSWHTANPRYQHKALENLHPKILSSVSLLHVHLTELSKICQVAENNSKAIDNKSVVSENKKQFSEANELIKLLQKNALSEWNDGIAPNLKDYISACTDRLKTTRGIGNTGSNLIHDMGTEMQSLWKPLESNIKVLCGNIYGTFDSWSTTAKKMKSRKDDISIYLQNNINIFAKHLIALTKVEAQAITGDNSHDMTIDNAWITATTQDGKSVSGMNPTREIFMKHNIESNLTIPGIVLIGETHVRNLNGNIANAKFHLNYEDFESDTMN